MINIYSNLFFTLKGFQTLLGVYPTLIFNFNIIGFAHQVPINRMQIYTLLIKIGFLKRSVFEGFKAPDWVCFFPCPLNEKSSEGL